MAAEVFSTWLCFIPSTSSSSRPTFRMTTRGIVRSSVHECSNLSASITAALHRWHPFRTVSLYLFIKTFRPPCSRTSYSTPWIFGFPAYLQNILIIPWLWSKPTKRTDSSISWQWGPKSHTGVVRMHALVWILIAHFVSDGCRIESLYLHRLVTCFGQSKIRLVDYIGTISDLNGHYP